MKWLTNAHIKKYERTIRALKAGRNRNRNIETGIPKSTETYTSKELIAMDMIGIYEVIA